MPLLALLCDASLKHLPEFNAQNCANMAWCFAHLAIYEVPLLASIALTFQKRIPTAIPQELFNMA